MKVWKGAQGQGLVEYALILVLVAVVVIVILALLGPAIGNVFSNIIQGIKLPLPRVVGGGPLPGLLRVGERLCAGLTQRCDMHLARTEAFPDRRHG